VRVNASAEITRIRYGAGGSAVAGHPRQGEQHLPGIEDRLPQGSGDGVGRIAAGDPGGNTAHRTYEDRGVVDQFRARSPWLDHGLRIGTGLSRHRSVVY
jgi:hypothetical protein